jgi:hypothetical protein
MLGFLTVGALKVVKQLLVCQRQQAAMNKILDIHSWAHTVLYEQRPNRIDKRIFCLSHLIYPKREKTRELRPIF